MKLNNNIFAFFKNSSRIIPKVILLIYVASFSAASYNHIVPFIRGGIHVYQLMNPMVPLWLDLYWTSLTLLDPLAVIILCMDIPKGMIVYMAVIISDVIINFSFVAGTYGIMKIFNFALMCQLGFLVFMIATYGFIKKELKKTKVIGRQN